MINEKTLSSILRTIRRPGLPMTRDERAAYQSAATGCFLPTTQTADGTFLDQSTQRMLGIWTAAVEWVCSTLDPLAASLASQSQAAQPTVEALVDSYLTHGVLGDLPNHRAQLIQLAKDAAHIAGMSQAAPKLDDSEQYRLQMAAIAAAAIGYWTESTGIKPEYDTLPLRDVAKLYAKYAALHEGMSQATKAQAEPDIGAMVNRFLGWKLPADFSPDCGISFDGRKDDEWNKNKSWPIGTNLLAATQAKAMFEHCLKDAARPTDDHLWEQTLRDRDTYHEWADKLAAAIAKHFDAEIGEHSNMNCPWAEALEVIEGVASVAKEATRDAADLRTFLLNHITSHELEGRKFDRLTLAHNEVYLLREMLDVLPTRDAKSVQALNGIPATMQHDEGAIARCFYCGRYSLDRATISDRQPTCECGKQHGWCGSFKRPSPDAKWSGKAPDIATTTSTVSAPAEPQYNVADALQKFVELAIAELFTGSANKAVRSDLRNLAKSFKPAYWNVAEGAQKAPEDSAVRVLGPGNDVVSAPLLPLNADGVPLAFFDWWEEWSKSTPATLKRESPERIALDGWLACLTAIKRTGSAA